MSAIARILRFVRSDAAKAVKLAVSPSELKGADVRRSLLDSVGRRSGV